MRKDIIIPPANHIALIAVQDETGAWMMHIGNQSNETIKNIMITSHGSDTAGVSSSTLRHFIEVLEPKTHVPFETIVEEVFVLNNSFFVTYYIGNTIYDKEYIFEANSIDPSQTVWVELMQCRGIFRD